MEDEVIHFIININIKLLLFIADVSSRNFSAVENTSKADLVTTFKSYKYKSKEKKQIPSTDTNQT